MNHEGRCVKRRKLSIPANTRHGVFSVLSDEVFLIILKRLDWRESINAGYVCQKWHQLSTDESIWKLHFSARFVTVSTEKYRLLVETCSWKCAFMVEMNKLNSFYLSRLVSNTFSQALVYCKKEPFIHLYEGTILETKKDLTIPTLLATINSLLEVCYIHTHVDLIFVGFIDGSFNIYSPATPFPTHTFSNAYLENPERITSACLSSSRICTLTSAFTLSLFSYSPRTTSPSLIYTQQTTFTYDLLNMHLLNETEIFRDRYDQEDTFDTLVMIAGNGVGHPLTYQTMQFCSSGFLKSVQSVSRDDGKDEVWLNMSVVTAFVYGADKLFLGHDNNTISMFIVEAGLRYVDCYHGHTAGVSAMWFEHGKLYSAGRDGVKVWRVKGDDMNLEYGFGFGCDTIRPIMIMSDCTRLVVVVVDSKVDSNVLDEVWRCDRQAVIYDYLITNK